MSKKKWKIVICLIYVISLLVFELIGAVNFSDNVERAYKNGAIAGPGLLAAAGMVPGIYHFNWCLVVAIIVKFIKKIPNDLKKLFYVFPAITFFSSIFIMSFFLKIINKFFP